MSLETKATLLGVTVSSALLALFMSVLPACLSRVGAEPRPDTFLTATNAASPGTSAPNQGQRLFDHNCSSCHGDDGRGDEGPSLFNLRLSDARISNRVKEGAKGEMPAFGKKLSDADISALITFLRTLKD